MPSLRHETRMQRTAVVGLHKRNGYLCPCTKMLCSLLDMKHTAVVGLHKQERVFMSLYQMPMANIAMPSLGHETQMKQTAVPRGSRSAPAVNPYQVVADQKLAWLWNQMPCPRLDMKHTLL